VDNHGFGFASKLEAEPDLSAFFTLWRVHGGFFGFNQSFRLYGLKTGFIVSFKRLRSSLVCQANNPALYRFSPYSAEPWFCFYQTLPSLTSRIRSTATARVRGSASITERTRRPAPTHHRILGSRFLPARRRVT